MTVEHISRGKSDLLYRLRAAELRWQAQRRQERREINWMLAFVVGALAGAAATVGVLLFASFALGV